MGCKKPGQMRLIRMGPGLLCLFAFLFLAYDSLYAFK